MTMKETQMSKRSIAIETNVPVPTVETRKSKRRAANAAYPFELLKPGHSLLVTDPAASGATLRNRLVASAHYFRKARSPKARFVARTVSAHAARIWRVA